MLSTKTATRLPRASESTRQTSQEQGGTSAKATALRRLSGLPSSRSREAAGVSRTEMARTVGVHTLWNGRPQNGSGTRDCCPQSPGFGMCFLLLNLVEDSGGHCFGCQSQVGCCLGRSPTDVSMSCNATRYRNRISVWSLTTLSLCNTVNSPLSVLSSHLAIHERPPLNVNVVLSIVGGS